MVSTIINRGKRQSMKRIARRRLGRCLLSMLHTTTEKTVSVVCLCVVCLCVSVSVCVCVCATTVKRRMLLCYNLNTFNQHLKAGKHCQREHRTVTHTHTHTHTLTHTQGRMTLEARPTRLVDLLNTQRSPCVTTHSVEPLASVAPH